MSETTSRSLGARYDRFIESQIASGEYDTSNEVIRAGLRLLEQRERRLEALRAALQEGLDSGDPQEFDIEEFLREMHERSDAE